MTPSDEAERLARCLYCKKKPARDRLYLKENPSESAIFCSVKCAAKAGIQLATEQGKFAALQRENARLREAVEQSASSVWHYFGHDMAGRSIADRLRAALQPKPEKTNES
jgi:hypothetical protein